VYLPHHHATTAIFILHDPVQWAEEIQVLCDLVEGGVLATHPQHANRKKVRCGMVRVRVWVRLCLVFVHFSIDRSIDTMGQPVH
jgi:hypothetical protein